MAKWQAPDRDSVVIPRAKYEGGHPLLGNRAREGELRIDADAVAIFPFYSEDRIPMSDVESVDITSLPAAAKSRLPWMVLFGVLGLAAKGSTSQAGVTVKTRDGTTAYFAIDRMTGIQVRARLAPLLRSVTVA